MNKQQIVSPLILVFCVFAVAALVFTYNQRKSYLHLRAHKIGRDFLANTNSPDVVWLGPTLRSRLEDLLSTNSGISAIKSGDEPDIGNGKAAVRVFLTNSVGLCIGVRLRPSSNPDKFDVLGFWTVSDPTR